MEILDIQNEGKSSQEAAFQVFYVSHNNLLSHQEGHMKLELCNLPEHNIFCLNRPYLPPYALGISGVFLLQEVCILEVADTPQTHNVSVEGFSQHFRENGKTDLAGLFGDTTPPSHKFFQNNFSSEGQPFHQNNVPNKRLEREHQDS